MIAVLHTTFPDRETAERIGRAMVERRLAACVSFTPCHSIYRWNGEVTEDAEVAATFKTNADAPAALAEAVAAAHPYTLPACTWSVVETTAEVTRWIDDATRL